jgi:VWFA-related protein
MRRSSRTVAFFACVGLALAAGGRAGSAQQAAPQGNQQAPTFRTGINFVSVDAIVTDKSGKAVDDLKPEDFEVTEQNKPQKVETFKLVSLDGNAPAIDGGPARAIRTDLDEEEEAARPDVRLFAIFLDDYHVRKESSLVMRNQVAKFVDTELGPSDMLGLMYPLESITDLRMTRDHDAVSRGIQQFEGRKYDYRPRNTIEESYQRYPTETIEQIRNQVSLSAIEGLIIHMGGLKGGRRSSSSARATPTSCRRR